MKNDHVLFGNRAGNSVLRGTVALIGAAMWLLSATAWAADVSVDCSNPKAKVKTITAALGQLNKTAENTIHVSGACSEWVRVQGFENLTLVANGSSSINAPTTPAPYGEAYVLLVYDSGNVAANGFTINGGDTGVGCARVRSCQVLNSTIQGASEDGVVATSNTNLYLTENTIQNNPDAGVYVSREVSATLFGGTIQQNGYGIRVDTASTLTFLRGPTGLVATVQDNTSDGVLVSGNSTVLLANGAAAIKFNGGAGINVQIGSVAEIRPNNEIRGGTNSAVEIGDLSLARFSPGNTVSGGPPAVNCSGKNAVASGLENLPGINTNCQ